MAEHDYGTAFDKVQALLSHYDALDLTDHSITRATYPLERVTSVKFQHGQGFDINTHCYLSFSEGGHTYTCSYDLSTEANERWARIPHLQNIGELLRRLKGTPAYIPFIAGLGIAITKEREEMNGILSRIKERLGGADIVERLIKETD